MTIEHDPTLQSLFDIARQDHEGDAFAARVMSRIDRSRRRAFIGWSTVGVALATCAWLVATPLLDALPLVTELVPATVIELDNSWFSQVFAPINSIAGLVALGAIVLRSIYRRLVS